MAKLRLLLQTNVVGPTYLTQVLTKDLRASQGRVVQISSVLGVVSIATRGAYSASKHALEVWDGRDGWMFAVCRFEWRGRIQSIRPYACYVSMHSTYANIRARTLPGHLGRAPC